MASKQKNTSITRSQLLCAMENVPEEATLWCSKAVNDGEDFLKGLCLNSSHRFTKAQVMAEINSSTFQEFPFLPGDNDYILLTPRLRIWRQSINQSQQFPAPPDAESYSYVQDRANPYYDIYFRIDREKQTITFALGDKKREIPLVISGSYVWKLTAKNLVCNGMDSLEKNFFDPFWNPIAVMIGRKVLKIKPVV